MTDMIDNRRGKLLEVHEKELDYLAGRITDKRRAIAAIEREIESLKEEASTKLADLAELERERAACELYLRAMRSQA